MAMTSSSSPVHSDRSVDLMASAGREGGVKFHEVVRGSDELKYTGSVCAVTTTIIALSSHA